jgi:hypothetical protein
MNKKRALPLIILAVFIVSIVSSCDLWNSIFGDPLVGTWAITAESVGGVPFTIGTGPTDMSGTFVIKSDNTLTLSGTAWGGAYTGTGTWSKSGATYTIVVTSVASGGSNTTTVSGTLSSDNKTFSGSGSYSTSVGGGSTVALTLVKQ